MDFMISQFCDEENYVNRKTSGSECVGMEAAGDENVMPPEMELGNVEYKVKLINPSTSRLQHLITQMKWRLREGQGEAIYEVGVEDGGVMAGLTDSELAASMATLRAMADSLAASMHILTERDVTPRGAAVRRRVVEVLVRRVPESQQFIELRLAILGGVDVGKSTLCGVLTQGCLDDGQGKTRQNLFRYLHEVQTGKTSSICLDVIGFDGRGKLVNYAQHSLEEVVERSSKLVTLIDLAGDIKYLKTTIYGLSGYNPHWACLMVSAESGPTAATREHLGLAMALNIPLAVVITKRDCVEKQQLDSVVASVSRLLAKAGVSGGVRRLKTKRDAVRWASQPDGVVPVLAISSVSGEGLRVLRCLLNVLPCAQQSAAKKAGRSQLSPVFTIEELFTVPHVGTVVCGMLAEGRLAEGDAVLVGPDRAGQFHSASVDSIRRSRQPVRVILSGEAASVAIRLPETAAGALRRGMVLLTADEKPCSCTRIGVHLFLLSHPTGEICVGFQATVYIGSVCETARVVDIEGDSIRAGAWATATLEFLNGHEFVRAGTPLILRQGKTKGMGEVVSIS